MYGWTEERLTALMTMTVMITGFWVIISCKLVHMYSTFSVFGALFRGYFALTAYFSVEVTAVLHLHFDTAAFLEEKVSNGSCLECWRSKLNEFNFCEDFVFIFL
jgi:hypothetical protein